MPKAAKPMPIRIVCGLGNPGAEYAQTRHSAGFATVDVLAERYGVRYWKEQAGSLVATISVRAADGSMRQVLLAKPQSFMNTSGGPLSKLMRAEKITPAELLVVHDEVDLPAGEVRAKWSGGLNAHNGLRSIAGKLGTRDFGRVRFGIGRPPGKMSVADWALRQLKGTFAEEFDVTASVAADVVESCLRDGVPVA
jgi:PTH1 family peptidyl-tRNA hydrolase